MTSETGKARWNTVVQLGLAKIAFFHGLAHLAAVDVEGTDDLYIRNTPTTHVRVHQTGMFAAVTPAIKFQPLNK